MKDGVSVLVGDVGVMERVSVSVEVGVRVIVDVDGIPVTENVAPTL